MEIAVIEGVVVTKTLIQWLAAFQPLDHFIHLGSRVLAHFAAHAPGPSRHGLGVVFIEAGHKRIFVEGIEIGLGTQHGDARDQAPQIITPAALTSCRYGRGHRANKDGSPRVTGVASKLIDWHCCRQYIEGERAAWLLGPRFVLDSVLDLLDSHHTA